MLKRSILNRVSLFLSLILLVGTVALAGCGSQATVKTEEDKPKFVNGRLTKEFHIKAPTLQDFNEIIIADQKGFFKEVGIVIDYTGVVPAGLMAQSVIRGDNNLFNSGHPITIANARESGAKIKIVTHSMWDDSDPDKVHITWMTKADGKINSPQDLVGKKIAMNSLGGCAELLTLEFLRQNGITKDKVTIVTMPDKQQEQALKQGLVDVAALHNVYQKAARNHGGVKVLSTSYDIGKGAGNGPASGLAIRAFSDDFIKEYPDVVKAYIAADIKAQHWINDNYDEALQIAADYLKIDVKDMAGNVYPPDNYIDEKKISFWITLMENNGFAQPGTIKVSDLYTNELNPYYTGELK
ncbi:ABC transporter substrate-binding protein [Sporomusa sp. KB1]|jgi:ABC-type nitrate/sulfonate/bicarbonate transport system substrate-binding protein|uniref:ABC transporter substrate-binding protein n=1 Tax=Sporomusa sp. KB1 TaxID=943346 RepID=UPI0011A011D9|nr:ABC transporter substrate-binding protein [Sporomusa sp. KB1]TWH47532.1 ABC-type nitrate/sulfonate/bicarbonate transport system substrate-binding protein [Sporomusa sp. KB1]